MNATPEPGRPRFRAVPTNEIPAVVPLRLILAETERIGAWLTGAQIYSTCMTFSVEARVQESDRLLGMYGFGKPESGHTPPMLLGFEDANGSVSTNLPGIRTGLSPSGGSGSRQHSRSGLILTPVPPAGLLHVYFAWPHFGIDETRHSLDASEFISATNEVRRLWDEVDPNTGSQFDLNDTTTPEMEIPPGGWFAAALERQKPPPRDPNAPRRINYAIDGDDQAGK